MEDFFLENEIYSAVVNTYILFGYEIITAKVIANKEHNNIQIS